MKRILCWIFGHDYKLEKWTQYPSMYGESVGEKAKCWRSGKCRRCGHEHYFNGFYLNGE